MPDLLQYWPWAVGGLALLALVLLLWFSVGARQALANLFQIVQDAVLQWLASRPLSHADCANLAEFMTELTYDQLPVFLAWLRFVFRRTWVVDELTQLLWSLESNAPPPPIPRDLLHQHDGTVKG